MAGVYIFGFPPLERWEKNVVIVRFYCLLFQMPRIPRHSYQIKEYTTTSTQTTYNFNEDNGLAFEFQSNIINASYVRFDHVEYSADDYREVEFRACLTDDPVKQRKKYSVKNNYNLR